MENHKNGVVRSTREPDISLTDEQSSRSVVISNLPANTERGKLYIHFQKTGQGGGEIESLELLEDGRAILTYEEATVAESVLQSKHEFGGVVLHLEPYKRVELKKQMEVFSLVSAKINPTVFNMTKEEIMQTLTNLQEKTEIQFLELCDGIWVSGTYQQIQTACSMLSAVATPRGEVNDHKDLECEPLNLDVQPKLMYILRKEIQEIQNKYEMKIDNIPNPDKAVLSPVGNEKLFEEGKEAFITLYQKTFQEMDEKRFELDIDDSAAKKTFKELMDEFDVVINQKGKEICIYGKDTHVGMAMQRLQGKPRRSRKAFKGETIDELKKPDTYAQLPKTLMHTLENGVTVSVYQGDITNQRVDVIVNAANEWLNHGAGVAGAIIKHGGYQIQQESIQLVQQYGPVHVGQVTRTGPGRLPCKGIIHAVGPQWRVHGPEGSRKLIVDACWNSFVLASQLGAGSIVLPGISSGIYGVPKEICAEMMFAAAEAFSCEATTQNRLIDIRFVNIDSPTNEAFRQEFHKRYVEKRSSGFENGPQNGKDSMTDNQNNGGQTNKGSQMPAVNPSKGQLQGERAGNPRSYAAAAAERRVPGTNQPKMDSEPLSSKAPTNVQSSGRSGFVQGFEDQRLQENKKLQEVGANPSKAASKEGRDDKPGTHAAAAALKRMEAENSSFVKAPQESKNTTKKSTTDKQLNDQSKTLTNKGKKHEGAQKRMDVSPSKVDSEASVQGKPSTDEQSSKKPSFNNGFKHRQGTTSRENTQETKGNQLVDQEHQEGNSIYQNDTRNDTDSAEIPTFAKAPQGNKSSTKPNDAQKKKEVESPPVTQEQDQSGHEDTKTIIEKSPTENQTVPVADISSSTHGRAKGWGRGKARNVKRSNESTQLNHTGRGRGALSLAATFDHTKLPGVAERYIKYPPKPEHNNHSQTHPQKLQPPENSLQDQTPVQPPGLKVTVEGLHLAANCKGEDGVDGSPETELLPGEETRGVKTSACNKRKIDQNDSQRSPKQRKEDETERDFEVEKDGEEETDKEGRRDGNGPNEMPNQAATKDDKADTCKQENMETKGNLNALSEKEKDEKQKNDENTSLKAESIAEKTKEDGMGKIEICDESEIELVKKNKDRAVDAELQDNPADQVDKPKIKGSGDDGEDSVRLEEPGDLKRSADRSHKENNDNKDTDGGKGDETKPPLQTYQDKTQVLDEPPQHESTMDSFVVLPLQGEQQPCRENQQSKQASEELNSSSESIELLEPQDEDINFLNDASFLESQTNESHLDQSNGKPISEKTSSEEDNSCKNLSCPKSKVAKEHVTTDESQKIKEQGNTETPPPDQPQQNDGQTSAQNIRSDNTETPLQDQAQHNEGQTFSEENSGKPSTQNIRSDNTETPLQDQPQQSKKQSSEENNEHVKQEGIERVDDVGQRSLTPQADQSDSDLIQAMGTLSLSKKSDDASKKDKPESLPSKRQKECGLCKAEFSSDRPEVILSGCGHLICKDCCTKYQKTQKCICPTCEKTAGCNVLQPPGGEMKHGILNKSLDGHNGHKTIYIDYHFPAGIQGSCHPNPGFAYDQLDRRTFLPDTQESRKVVELLEEAFNAELLFTVGKGTISDPHKENQIVFSDAVEHKINITGGPSCHGYPDPDYLKRVKKQLEVLLSK